MNALSPRRASRAMSRSFGKLLKSSYIISTLKEKQESCTVEDLRKAIDFGGYVAEVAEFGMTPLMIACGYNCSNEVIEFLIDQGAEVDRKNMIGQTALFNASAASKRLVDLLIERGADVNIIDTLTGRTALMECAGYNPEMEAVTSLVMAGAYVDVLDSFGKSAADFASEQERLSEYIRMTSMPDGQELPTLPAKPKSQVERPREPVSPVQQRSPDSLSPTSSGRDQRKSFRSRFSFSAKSSQQILYSLQLSSPKGDSKKDVDSSSISIEAKSSESARD